MQSGGFSFSFLLK